MIAAARVGLTLADYQISAPSWLAKLGAPCHADKAVVRTAIEPESTDPNPQALMSREEMPSGSTAQGGVMQAWSKALHGQDRGWFERPVFA